MRLIDMKGRSRGSSHIPLGPIFVVDAKFPIHSLIGVQDELTAPFPPLL